MDAGGLAQMTYNNHNAMGSLGMPSGFASRGKAGNIKRLSVAPPPKISTIDENQPAPRTSRSHLLAGLRTAPKSPGVPSSAPPTQMQQPGGINDNRHMYANRQHQQQAVPQTAIASSFSNSYQNQPNNNVSSFGQFYLPEQILAPPSIQFGDGFDESQMDPQLYEELVRTNQYLAQQQARLQQQLISVTAAAQQFQNMNLSQNSDLVNGQMAMNPALGFYNQQLSQGMQPIIQAIPGYSGLFAVYNPMTGQTNVHSDVNQQEQVDSLYSTPPQPAAATITTTTTTTTTTPGTFRVQPASQTQSQGQGNVSSVNNWRSGSPPKSSPSPPRDETLPLPPPSANAFRPVHRKNNLSLASMALSSMPDGGLRTAGLKSAGFPQTPMTGTFGPGQAREGEHPTRQPRGPPSMEELVAKPTTRFEGSKNFASRRRRGALNHLVRAGLGRRSARDCASVDSVSNDSPVSEQDPSSVASMDNDDASVRSGSASLDGQPESGTHSPIMNAIGSERKEFKERSRDRTSLDEPACTGKSFEVLDDTRDVERRKSPLMVLAKAGKRRSVIN